MKFWQIQKKACKKKVKSSLQMPSANIHYGDGEWYEICFVKLQIVKSSNIFCNKKAAFILNMEVCESSNKSRSFIYYANITYLKTFPSL